MRLLHVVAFSKKLPWLAQTKVITLKTQLLVGSNQGNYFENATACSKRMLKTTVATQLNYETSFK